MVENLKSMTEVTMPEFCHRYILLTYHPTDDDQQVHRLQDSHRKKTDESSTQKHSLLPGWGL